MPPPPQTCLVPLCAVLRAHLLHQRPLHPWEQSLSKGAGSRGHGPQGPRGLPGYCGALRRSNPRSLSDTRDTQSFRSCPFVRLGKVPELVPWILFDEWSAWVFYTPGCPKQVLSPTSTQLRESWGKGRAQTSSTCLTMSVAIDTIVPHHTPSLSPWLAPEGLIGVWPTQVGPCRRLCFRQEVCGAGFRHKRWLRHSAPGRVCSEPPAEGPPGGPGRILLTPDP